MLALWLHGRPTHTQAAYRRELEKLRTMLAGKSLAEVTLADLQRHGRSLFNMAVRSQARAIDAIRSFYAFHATVGTIPVNPSAALTSPKVPQDLAQRILTEADVAALIEAAPPGPERVAVRLLYLGGLRAAELCGLYYRHLAPRLEGGQVTVTGKGGKTRAVLLPDPLFHDLLALSAYGLRPAAPVFPSPITPGKPWSHQHLRRIVKRAAARAGLSEKISSHWLRHSHASHALDHGCPVHLLKETLGHASIATTDRYSHARPGESSARFLVEKKP